MDCTCNCFGVATAARVPVKRYNLLVPDVFPVSLGHVPTRSPLPQLVRGRQRAAALHMPARHPTAPSAHLPLPPYLPPPGGGAAV